MKLSEIVDRALFYVSVPKCVACGVPLDHSDNVYCKDCLPEFWAAFGRDCSVCFKPLCECSCSNKYLVSKKVKKVVKLFRYIQREENYCSNSLIYSLKKDNRRDVLELASSLLSDALLLSIEKPSEYIFTNVPRRRSAIIKRGFDHAAMLSRAVAKKLGGEYRALFISKASKAQKTLTGIARHKNAVFDIKSEADLDGKSVIIIDDVITSGSSIGAVAELAASIGAGRIVAAALGIAYKDDLFG